MPTEEQIMKSENTILCHDFILFRLVLSHYDILVSVGFGVCYGRYHSSCDGN